MAECARVLEQGIFDVQQYRSNVDYKRDVDLLLYKSEFRTHGDAQNAGFGLGFPVYGVPVSMNATYSQSQVETWKADHVELANDNTSYHEVRSRLVRRANADILNAWLRCIEIEAARNDSGLLGRHTPVGRDYIYFSVRFRPTAQGPDVRISAVQLIGLERISGQGGAIGEGRTIPNTVEGIGEAFRIADRQNTALIITTDIAGTLELTFRAQEREQEASGAVAEERKQWTIGAIPGEIRTLAFPVTAELERRGWMECDGRELDIDDYPALYSVLKNRYGSPAPGQVFKIPDYRGKFLRGWDHGSGVDPNASGRLPSTDLPIGEPGASGNEVGSKQPDSLRSHRHPIPAGKATGTFGGGDHGGGYHWGGDTREPYTDLEGGSETRPLNLYVTFMIFTGVFKD
ncbi:MAG: phage tail protein [Bryobacteraceae bacterium]